MAFGRGRGRGGKGRGCGNFEGRNHNSGPPYLVNVNPTLTPNLNEPSEALLTRTPEPSHRTSIETQISRNLEGSSHPSSENLNSGVASCTITKKKGRGRYKSMQVDMKTKYGGKIIVDIPDDVERAVRSGARDIVNYCGLIVRSTISFRDGNWPTIFAKYGEVMWLKVKDKFEIGGGRQEHVLRGFVISTMQRLLRAWKTRLRVEYLRYKSDKDRLSHPLDNVAPEDWIHLVRHFGSPKFQAISEINKINRGKQATKHSCGSKSFVEVEEATKDPHTGEKAQPDKVWELQHTHKNDKGELSWSDPKSQEIHGHIQALVEQQQSEQNENPMTRDEILANVLGERTGYVRGKGYGKKPPRKNSMQQADVEASVSSAMENMRQQMRADIQADMQSEMDRKLQEEREIIHAEMDRRLQEQMAAVMSRIQQGQSS